MKLKERQRLCVHPSSEYVDKDDTRRHEWIKTNCGACGKFLGYRPYDPKTYYKKHRATYKAKGRDRDG